MNNSFFDKINNFLSWKNISFLGKSKFINSFSYWFLIVPFLAKFTNYIETNLPFNLQIFFVCSLCFGISNIFYKICCPEIIKLYEHPQDFLSKGGNACEINRIIEDNNINENMIKEKVTDTEIKQKVSQLVEGFNTQRNFIRHLISFFYLLGLSLLLVVLVMNVLSVFNMSFKNQIIGGVL
jgi:hypothetical protein